MNKIKSFLISIIFLLITVNAFATPVLIGGGANYTDTTISTVCAAIGTSNKATVEFKPGTWTITAALDLSSYTNIEFVIPRGVTFSGSYAITFPPGTVVPLSAFSSLSAAKTILGTSVVTLLVNRSETISEDVTLLSTTKLKFNPGCILSPDTGITLTLGSQPDALPGQQIFSGSGTVTGLNESWPDWFATNTTPGITDMAGAVGKAVASVSGGTVIFQDKEYLLTDAYIHVTASQTWKSVGGHTTLTFSGKPTEDINILAEGGSLTELSVAPPNITRGDKTITFSSDPGTLSGYLVLRDSTASSWNAASTSYVKGEIAEFTQASEVLTLKDRTFDGYTAGSNFKAYTYTPIKFNIEGITMVFDSGTAMGLWTKRVADFRFTNCSFSGSDEQTVTFGEYTYKGVITGSHAKHTATGGSMHYGFNVSGGQNIQFIGCSGESTRHAFDAGGAIIPNRKIAINGGQWSLSSEGAGLFAIDLHGNSEWVEITNVQANGIMVAGDNINISGGQVTGTSYGISIREMLGSNFSITGVDLLLYYPNPSSSRATGIGMESGATGSFTTRGGYLNISKNRIISSSTTARYGIQIGYESGFTMGDYTDVNLSDNYIYLTAQKDYAIVAYGLANSPLRTLSVNKRNIIKNGGMYLGKTVQLFVDDNDIYNAPTYGILTSDTAMTSDVMTAHFRRNNIFGTASSGISINGASSHKYLLVEFSDNYFSGISSENQSSATEETCFYVADAAFVRAYRNTNITAGANQSYGYTLTSGVTLANIFNNNWSVANNSNNAGTTYGDQLQTYTVSNVTSDRSYDADSTTDAEIADVLGTLINDLKSAKIIK